MELAIAYFILGFGLAISLRVWTGEKNSLKNWLKVIVLWPLVMFLIVLSCLERIEI